VILEINISSHLYIDLVLVVLKLNPYNILRGRGDHDFMVGFIYPPTPLVPITTKLVSSILAHAKIYSI